MPATLRQTVLDLLERVPVSRRSYNALVFIYWLQIDGYGTLQKDFWHLTPLESICREAREIWRLRPELSPTANQSPAMKESVEMVLALFPATELA